MSQAIGDSGLQRYLRQAADDDDGLPRFFGKYRGVVANNNDPDKLGRLLLTVPAVDGMRTNWRCRARPMPGPASACCPPVGALVWVEFEGGDPNYPIWVGCFWRQAADVPIVYGRNADNPAKVKVLKTDCTTIIIDAPHTGEVMVTIAKPAVTQYPVTLTLFSRAPSWKPGSARSPSNPSKASRRKSRRPPSSDARSDHRHRDADHGEDRAVADPMTGASITIACPELTATIDAATSVTTGEAFTVTAGEISATAVSTALTTILEVTGTSNFVGAVRHRGRRGHRRRPGRQGAADFAGGVAIEGGGVIDGAPINRAYAARLDIGFPFQFDGRGKVADVPTAALTSSKCSKSPS